MVFMRNKTCRQKQKYAIVFLRERLDFICLLYGLMHVHIVPLPNYINTFDKEV